MADWSLELDQWVSLVMIMGRHRFAVGAEVCVMTDGTFVSVAPNVRLAASGGTQRTIAIDTTMNLSSSTEIGDRLIESCESMARVNLIGAENACRAEVPVWAFQALVSHSSDGL